MLRLFGWFMISMIPLTICVVLYFPQYWEILFINILFYSKIIIKLAKTEIILFISKMTILKLGLLTLKRFVMDNIVSRAISEHFTVHVAPEAKKWWKSLDMKGMLLWFLPASIITMISTWVVGIGNTTLFLFIKTLIVGFFKLLWLILAKIFLFFTNSVFAQIIELLAISYLIDKLANTKFFQKWLKPSFSKIGTLFSRFTAMLENKIHKPINSRVDEMGMKAAAKLRASRKKRQQFLDEKNKANVINEEYKEADALLAVAAEIQNKGAPNDDKDKTDEKG